MLLAGLRVKKHFPVAAHEHRPAGSMLLLDETCLRGMVVGKPSRHCRWLRRAGDGGLQGGIGGGRIAVHMHTRNSQRTGRGIEAIRPIIVREEPLQRHSHPQQIMHGVFVFQSAESAHPRAAARFASRAGLGR